MRGSPLCCAPVSRPRTARRPVGLPAAGSRFPHRAQAQRLLRTDGITHVTISPEQVSLRRRAGTPRETYGPTLGGVRRPRCTTQIRRVRQAGWHLVCTTGSAVRRPERAGTYQPGAERKRPAKGLRSDAPDAVWGARCPEGAQQGEWGRRAGARRGRLERGDVVVPFQGVPFLGDRVPRAARTGPGESSTGLRPPARARSALPTGLICGCPFRADEAGRGGRWRQCGVLAPSGET